MEVNTTLKLLFGLIPATVAIILSISIYFFCKRRSKNQQQGDIESRDRGEGEEEEETSVKDMMIAFNGGEDLTAFDILDAPGEVIGKSSYGTIYKAALEKNSTVRLLRFVRPACTAKMEEVESVIRLLGRVRHPNLVPLEAFYAGPRGEKLLVHPFYRCGNLAQFIRDGNAESHEWAIIYRVSVDIVKGLNHLHTKLQKPIIHGNLKSKNILLDSNYQPYISDSGLHLILNPTAGQEMLEASAAQGYKAPELIKMKDANKESDIYSLGVIFLEMLTGKEPINQNPSPADEDIYLPNAMRNAILDHRIGHVFHPGILLSQNNDQRSATEKYFRLAMACCSPSPPLRPDTKQVMKKLEEIGRSFFFFTDTRG